MPIDGFQPKHAAPFSGRWPAGAPRFYDAIARLGDRAHVEVVGLEHIPPGRALLVANHAFGFDVAFPMAAIQHATGRAVWALGEHAWWKVPFVRRFAAGVGVVDGTPENVDRLLRAEQLVLVLPGGLREAVKPRELRYRLLWGHRYGFVRAAIRTSSPIVPVASIGADEIWSFVGNAFARGRRWLGRAFPLPRPRHGLPIPHLVRLRFVIGAPIVLHARPEEADDHEVLRHSRLEVEGALQEIIDEELARRAGLDVDRDEP